MATIKQPHWDKREGSLIIMVDPDGPNSKATFTEPLKLGQRATGTIGGVEVTVLLTEIISHTTAHARIVRIWNGTEDLDSLGDIFLEDSVVISHDNVKRLDVDANTP
jgi:hypothetical protein